jgi:hypothetical protein
MAMTCSVCRSPNVMEINESLVAGGTLRSIADRWSVSKTSLLRHKADHLPKTLLKAKDAAEVLSADNLLDTVGELEGDARRIAKAAEASGDLRVALAGIRELVRITELLAKLTGQLDGKPVDPGGVDNRRVIFNFPVATPEMIAEVANARTIDLPTARPRLLTRPSDGKQI